MQVRTRAAGDVRLLDLAGRLTLGVGDQALRETVKGLVSDEVSKLVINLAEVEFADSSGLAEMIAAKKLAMQHGGDVKLLGPGKKVREILLVSRLTDIFTVFEDETEAVGSF